VVSGERRGEEAHSWGKKDDETKRTRLKGRERNH